MKTKKKVGPKKVPNGYRITAWDRMAECSKTVRLYKEELVSFAPRLKVNSPLYCMTRLRVQQGIAAFENGLEVCLRGEQFCGGWIERTYKVGRAPVWLSDIKRRGKFRIGCHSFSSTAVRTLKRWVNQ